MEHSGGNKGSLCRRAAAAQLGLKWGQLSGDPVGCIYQPIQTMGAPSCRQMHRCQTNATEECNLKMLQDPLMVYLSLSSLCLLIRFALNCECFPQLSCSFSPGSVINIVWVIQLFCLHTQPDYFGSCTQIPTDYVQDLHMQPYIHSTHRVLTSLVGRDWLNHAHPT